MKEEIRKGTRKSGTKESQSQTVMYIGPTIPGVVVQNTTFTNGLPEEAAKAADAISAIRSLLVPISSLAQARSHLKETGNALQVCYQYVVQTYRKGEIS